MIYIYDARLDGIQNNPSFVRFGTRYKLLARHKMGEQLYFTFSAPGCEKLLVVPGFRKQYDEFGKKLLKFGQGKTYDAYRKFLRTAMDVEEESETESEKEEGVVVKTLTGQYRDIGLTVCIEGREAYLAKEFEIRQNNVFGNGIMVSVVTEDD